MADVHTKDIRSYNMSRIRGKDTKPELLVRKFLFACGFRYRLHDKKLPGKPDIVFSRYKTVLFIHGCFWHGHEGCRYFVIPKTRTEWWTDKIRTNSQNDIRASEKLTEAGWKVIIIWECELKKEKIDKTLKRLVKDLESNA